MSCRTKSEWQQEVLRWQRAGHGLHDIARKMDAPIPQVANTLFTLRDAPDTETRPTASPPAPRAVYREVRQPVTQPVMQPAEEPGDRQQSAPPRQPEDQGADASRAPVPPSDLKMSAVKSHVEQDLESLKRVEEAAWRQFEVSCRPRATVSTRKLSSHGDEETAVHDTVSQRETTGDARYLNIMLKCIAQRQKLWDSIGLLEG